MGKTDFFQRKADETDILGCLLLCQNACTFQHNCHARAIIVCSRRIVHSIVVGYNKQLRIFSVTKGTFNISECRLRSLDFELLVVDFKPIFLEFRKNIIGCLVKLLGAVNRMSYPFQLQDMMMNSLNVHFAN